MSRKIYVKYIKRLLDLLVSVTGLVLFSWLMLLTAILVRIKIGKPVIYKQQRPGYQEKIFSLYKFRTMTDARDAYGNLLPDEKRLTEFGRFLRSTSLDELPQLWNILRGDMSVIGPRPLLVSYLDRYTPRQHHRHDVKPGLFGLAGVNGRNAQSWESKFRYDLKYVQHISLRLDIYIFLKCIRAVLKKEGISENGNATASEFMGCKKTDKKIL